MKSLFVNCPHCKKKFDYYCENSNKFRPFCSERCKMVDLGHWFNESYSVEASMKVNENEEEEEFKESGDNGND